MIRPFQVFPDEKTHDQLFNGIKFTDIPIVLIRLHRNNTKLNAMLVSLNSEHLLETCLINTLKLRYADGRPIWTTTPAKHGFKNAKKRTNVAGQANQNIAWLFAHAVFKWNVHSSLSLRWLA